MLNLNPVTTSTHTRLRESKYILQLSLAFGECVFALSEGLSLTVTTQHFLGNGQNLPRLLSGSAVLLSSLHLIFTFDYLSSSLRKRKLVTGCAVSQHLTPKSVGPSFFLRVCFWWGSQDTNTVLCIVGTRRTLSVDGKTKRGDSESQRMLTLGPGWSNPVRETIKMKRCGLKLSGHALVHTAGVGTFLCPVHLTWGVIRAYRRAES